MKPARPRVAIVHEWLVHFAGSERVVAELLRLYPDADLFAVIDFLDEEGRATLGGRRAETTFLQRAPFIARHYTRYLAWMPLAIEQLDLRRYDLVISSSHAVAKGVLTGPDQLHVSYVHTPMRYAWDLQHEYLDASWLLRRGPIGWYARLALHRLRLWDVASAQRVDRLLANSRHVAKRIAKYYGRPAEVVHPPVATDFFRPGGPQDDSYVTVSRLVPYKRVDLIVKAFARMPQRRLVVIGDGPERSRIAAVATPNVSFLGAAPASVVLEHLQRAAAFVFAAMEDFGIAPVEAQACGTPVIAYGRGGALESVLDDSTAPTGLFFEDQSVDAIVQAVEDFEARREAFDATRIRSHAERFSREAFRAGFTAAVAAAATSWSGGRGPAWQRDPHGQT